MKSGHDGNRKVHCSLMAGEHPRRSPYGKAADRQSRIST